MRNKSTVFVFVSVVIWATVTYYFLFYQSGNGRDNRYIEEEIKKLEKEISQLLQSNTELLQKLYAQKNLQLGNSKSNNTLKSFLKNEKPDEVPEVIGDIEEKSKNSSSVWNVTQEVKIVPKNRLDSGLPVIAVLVLSCNRVTIQRCLDQLIKFRPNVEQFPIIVSQDCGHGPTSDVIRHYGNKVTHIQQPDQSDIRIPPREKKFKGYFKIARHYKWALNEVFFKFGFQSAIVIEDDLDIASDFFEYFLGTHHILNTDPSLWCVSAWNDNGKADLIDEHSPQLLYRTDFFPGLGWMLTRRLWQELSPKWPKSYWDDWVRLPEQRKNRACIRPEISRTRTFGKIGVSNGMFYEKHLKFIKLNEQSVPFTKRNLTYLRKENYDLAFVNTVYKSEIVTHTDLKNGKVAPAKSVRISYNDRQSYKSAAKMLGLMDDFKSGVPRTAYRGVVSFFYNGQRVYLAPSPSWSGYDLSWS